MFCLNLGLVDSIHFSNVFRLTVSRRRTVDAAKYAFG